MSLRVAPAQGRDPEAGLTLVELLMSIFILGILMAAFVGGITTSLQTIAANQREARAVALQSEMIERFQTLEWDELTIRCEDDGSHPWATVPEPPEGPTDSVVGGLLVACDDDDASFAQVALETRGEGDYEFEVETHIVFVDRDDSPEHETKQIVTFVRWETPTGVDRETMVSAERGPPPRSIGFVPASVDRDLDGVEDGSDNCPDTVNTDQADTLGPSPVPVDGNNDGDYDDDEDTTPTHAAAEGAPDGVGDACDADGDGVRDADDNCPNTFNWDQDPSACGATSPTGELSISHLTVYWWHGNKWVDTGSKLCVDAGDALQKNHRLSATLFNLPEGPGNGVKMTVGKWTSDNNDATPDGEHVATAVYSDPPLGAPDEWSAFLESGLGRFRAGKTTTVLVDAERGDGAKASKSFTLQSVKASTCPN